jgi:hypothetical protein
MQSLYAISLCGSFVLGALTWANILYLLISITWQFDVTILGLITETKRRSVSVTVCHFLCKYFLNIFEVRADSVIFSCCSCLAPVSR